MNIKKLDFFKIPEGLRIPVVGGIIYSFISKREQQYIKDLSISQLSLYEGRGRKEKIIVSITTFPARINVVQYSIKSLMHQTLPPDRIVLWLADNQFPSHKLPKELEELCQKGLEVRYVEDLKSHKKYFYALQEQTPNELVVTFDDDLIYPEDSLQRLYETHLRFPKCIVCNRAQLSVSESSKLLPYSCWKVLSEVGVKSPDSRLFPSTGGGTLYPFGCVNKEAFNIEHMKQNAFTADDLWVRFMSAMNHIDVIKTRKYHKTFSVIENSQAESLQVVNCLKNGNDEAVSKLSKCYPKALEYIIYGK